MPMEQNIQIPKLSDLREQDARTEKTRRTDGWIGGRPNTWHGHYHESPASRAGHDAYEMAGNDSQIEDVATQLSVIDQEILYGDDEIKNAGLTVEPLSPTIGTVIHGIDLANPTDAQVEQVQRLYLSRKVVFFREQGHITREEHIAFAKSIADIGLAYGRQQALYKNTSPEEYPEILLLYADEKHPFVAANWHSDVTWSDQPPLGSMLLSRKSPPMGGDTVFLDCYAAWNSLSPKLKTFLEGLQAIHGRAGRNEVAHPICRTHPVTGKRALYINPTFTNSIRGLEQEESSELLAKLYAKMYSTPENVCRFKWQDGSVAMWDNRACQHYAVADFWPHERKMERVTLVDRSEENEIPFWQDADGVKHYSERLATRESIDTGIGYA